LQQKARSHHAIGLFFRLTRWPPLAVQVLLLADHSKSSEVTRHEGERTIVREALVEVPWYKSMSKALSFKVRQVITIVSKLAAHKNNHERQHL
jgi:hypothetical protein